VTVAQTRFCPASGEVPLRFCIELIQAFPRAEPYFSTFINFGVTLAGGHLHSANRVIDWALINVAEREALMLFVSMVAMRFMRHVTAATKTHHEVEQTCDNQQPNPSKHEIFSFLVACGRASARPQHVTP
jgi:hypothetical protein